MSEVNEMIPCPYNTSHLILKHRMANHLIKCRQQHPTDKFETCPFNSTHDVPAPELQYHVETCPDRRILENYIYVIGDPEPEEPERPAEIEIPPCEENWDEEGTASGSYLDAREKVLEKEMVFRKPVGMSKTSRKEFLKNEVQRFGNFNN